MFVLMQRMWDFPREGLPEIFKTVQLNSSQEMKLLSWFCWNVHRISIVCNSVLIDRASGGMELKMKLYFLFNFRTKWVMRCLSSMYFWFIITVIYREVFIHPRKYTTNLSRFYKTLSCVNHIKSINKTRSTQQWSVVNIEPFKVI